MKQPTLSVIMPALNEEKNIEAAINSTFEALKKYNIDGEIIVVNDGSSDDTKNIVENLAQNNDLIKLINHDKPQGIGASFWDGVKHSNNDVVVMFPGDNENDPDDALRFFYLMNDVDIVIPFIHNLDVRDRIRRIISSIYRFIVNVSFGINLNYTNGTIFFRRIILEGLELNTTGFFFNAELLIKLIRHGYLFAEVPNFLSVRGGGKSKAISLKSLIIVIKGYLRLFFDIYIRQIESRDKYFKKRSDFRKLNETSITYIRQKDFDERVNKTGEESRVIN